MNQTVEFQRSHSILIDASAEEVLNYVSNPNSWPEWIASSHHIDSPDHPLRAGEKFHEKWHIRRGEVRLDWIVTEREEGNRWVAKTRTEFIGEIVVRYDVEMSSGQCRFTRTLINPARPKPPTPEMIQRIDEEAEISLENIKRNVESRMLYDSTS
jgi:hypothetical protein